MFFFRRKLSSEELAHVKDMLEQAQDSAQVVNITIDPEVFFCNLHQMLDLLLALRSYEKYKIFVRKTPSENYRKIINDLGTTVDAFIDRYIRSNPLFDSKPLSFYFDKAHTYWPDHPDYPHYKGSLYTKANYRRAKSIARSSQEIPVDDDLLPSEMALFAEIARINAEGGNISDEQYMQLREFEWAWLERHYDFSSLSGIESIPVSVDVPGAPTPPGFFEGHTGRVYYYLRRKAYGYEEAGNRELALACMRKSVELVMCGPYLLTNDCYPLVRMLARFGFVDEARSAKRKFDSILSDSHNKEDDNKLIDYEFGIYQDWLIVQWLQQNFPGKCPKNVTGYRRMKTQNTKNYQLLKAFAAEHGKTI